MGSASTPARSYEQDLFAVMGARGSSGRGGRSGAAQAGRGGQQPEGSKEDSDHTIRKILAELTEAVRVPPLTLTISQEEDWTITPGVKATDVVRTSSKARNTRSPPARSNAPRRGRDRISSSSTTPMTRVS